MAKSTQGFVDALNVYMDRRDQRKPRQQTGRIVAVNPTTATVNIGGSLQHQEAMIPEGLQVVRGDTCVLASNQSNGRVRWVILSILQRDQDVGIMPTGRDYSEIFPPNNIRTGIVGPGFAALEWDAPVSQSVVFEIASAPSPDPELQNKTFYTRGSYYIIVEEAHARVRSIAHDGQTSNWSSWVHLIPGSTASTSQIEYLTFDGIPVVYNLEFVIR